MLDVKSPAKIKIRPCPNANKNNIKTAIDKFLPIAAKAIIPARIGVEQGVPARAKVIPKSTGYKNIEFVELVGIALIIVGVSKSRIPRSLSPITSNNDAIKIVKYPPIEEAKTLPVRAQAIPIIVNNIAVTNIKKNRCSNVLK